MAAASSAYFGWDSLGISNDFVFGKVMHDERLLLELLRMILPELSIERIEFMESQKTFEEGLDIHGTRLDIFAVSNDGTVFDIEM